MRTNDITNAMRSTLHFISNIFISNVRLKLANNYANAKRHPEAELLLFENYSHSLFRLSSENNTAYPKYKDKNMYVCIHEFIRLIMMKIRMKMKNGSYRYDRNRPWCRHGHKYSEKKCYFYILSNT